MADDATNPTSSQNADSQDGIYFIVSGLLAALLIVAIGAAVYFWHQQQIALQARSSAQVASIERNLKAAKVALDAIVGSIADSVPDAGDARAEIMRPLLSQTENAIGQLATQAANDLDAKRTQGTMYVQFANAYLRLGDKKLALNDARKGADIFRILADKNPDNLVFRSNFGLSLETLGDVLAANGDNHGALGAYRENLEISRALAAKDPSNPQWRTDTVLSLWKLGDAGDNSPARFEEALGILKQLKSENKLTAAQQGWIEMIEAAKTKAPAQAQ